MNFNSLEYMIFLPIVCVVHWLVPQRFRWMVLLAASLYFYMSWNVYLVVLLGVTIFISYSAALLIHECRKRCLRLLFMWGSILVCLGILIFFKYADYIGQSIASILTVLGGKGEYTSLRLLLPMGISFYTFQTLSYVVDVYKGKTEPERHFGYYSLFVCFFPQLVAGPIERSGDLLPQLRGDRSLNKEDVYDGFRWLLSGYIRKCVIADTVGEYVNRVYADLSSCNSFAIFAASALFMVQIYNDFAGYSEIAMGSARMLGIRLSINFNRPLTSASVTEFFRRWHITLNRWFTDYVYIPLGGNRRGQVRRLLNTMIVFTLCGLWHGADNTYLLWGLAAGASVCVESLLRKPYRKLAGKNDILNSKAVYFVRRFVLLILFTFSCVLFRSADTHDMGEAFTGIFFRFEPGYAGISDGMRALGIDRSNLLFLVIVVSTMSVLPDITQEKPCRILNDKMDVIVERQRIGDVVMFVLGILAIILCWLNLLSDTGTSAFSYFQF